MLQQSSRYTTTWVDTVNKVKSEAWNILAKPLATPFFEWEWLSNLESSGCAIAQQGWLPSHLLVWQGDVLVAAAPLYLKGHSQGEFIFDHQWADLSYRLGIEYYPKLLGMAPFTPAVGYRFLVHPELSDRPDELSKIYDLMLTEIDRLCDKHKMSGCNFLYVDPSWKHELESRGFTTWMHHSYVWENQEFTDFDDYLKNFNANQRRNIKRERKSVESTGISMRVYTGEEIPSYFYGYMYELYNDHCNKFWGGSKYLNRKFFENLAHSFRDRLVFVAGEIEDHPQPLGMSFCIRKDDQLFGRYWGSIQEIDCLHFNACYYKPIEWAISQGIKRFDPGAGGQHKKRRGFPATPNYSLHRFYRDRLKQILIPYISEVNTYEAKQIQAINNELPFDFAPPDLHV